MEHIRNFLWFCSGAVFTMLKKSPTEASKYVGIGGTVFFTGLLAAFSGGYALFTVFENGWFAILFALIWGLLIFNLDRFIVSSMRKGKSSWSNWKVALPRLVMAVILAVVISKPLELKIFEREINRQLDEEKIIAMADSKMKVKEVYPETAALQAKIETLKTEIETAKSFRDQKQEEYDLERFGTKTPGTSGIVGLGSNARKKEEQLDKAQQQYEALQEFNQTQILDAEARIGQYEQMVQNQFEQQQQGIAQFDGLAARMEALSVLTTNSKAMATAHVFILLLFIAIETAPIFVKLISPIGPYDRWLMLHETEVQIHQEEVLTLSQEKSKARIHYFMATHHPENELKIDQKLKTKKAEVSAETTAAETYWGKWGQNQVEGVIG
ncbi:DUF4407 domain-containing protein [Pararhodonellum marinum]|uniref:DUF4407 domain-containing protein n=1 Tax=Pararhodonellum marinum TaxID=2755358 RepID=UPI0018906A5E|nr:DUF4407 domain-containing protein [Pararhodonellum marinum]